MIALKVTAGRSAFLDLLRATEGLDKDIRASLSLLAREAQGVAERAILAPKSGRAYRAVKAATKRGLFIPARRASAPGESPGRATGNLFRALRHKAPRRNPYAQVVFAFRGRGGAPHRHLLEFGTRHMAARPLWSRLEAMYEPRLVEQVEAALDKAASRF